MKKILLSFLGIALVSLAAVGATVAYFSDTEIGEDNTFSAGTLDLKTNDVDGVTSAYVLTNMKPGAWDLAGQVILKNAGTVKGHAWLEITNVKNLENSCIDPEDGDTSCGSGDDQGELGDKAKSSFQINVSPWTRYGGSDSINDSEGTRVDLFDLDAGDTMPLVVYGVWPEGGNSDNLAQGDSVTFDVVFHLDQAN